MRASIAFHRTLSTAYRHLGLAAPGFPAEVRPGQFVMVRPPWVGDPFLPRAFSIYRLVRTAAAAPIVEILYKIVGKGTQHLSRLEVGQEVEILGPLGNSFTVPPADETAVLVAGGIGVPPIAAFARALALREGAGGRGQGAGAEPQSMVVFLGGRTAEDILCVDDFGALGIRPQITTEDGSLGTQGLITDPLAPFLASPLCPVPCAPSPVVIYTCGPPGMLAAVARLAEAQGIPCQVSVEANMACGFGACMGCAIEIRSADAGRHYKLVCTDGPVFDAREIAWGGESREPGAERHAAGGCGCRS